MKVTKRKDTSQEIYKVFSRTSYGRELEKTARYDRFRPAGYSVKYWERLLGPDVNNLHHMRQSIAVAQWFVEQENAIEPEKFSAGEISQLRVTAALHDQAEAILGDIPRGHKSQRQREREAKLLHDYETKFVPHLHHTDMELYRIGRDEIAFGDVHEKLAGAFRVIELIGFMQNATLAIQRLGQLDGPSLSYLKVIFLGLHDRAMYRDVVVALRRLSAEVLGSGVIGELITCGSQYPSAHVSLRQHATKITAGMDAARQETFDWYDTEDPYAGTDEKAKRLKELNRQKQLWKTWQAKDI